MPNILNWKSDVSLNTYLVQKLHQQSDFRRLNFNKAISSKANTLAYIQTVKKRFKEVLGELPTKADLNVQITGTIEKKDYRIEKLVYQSFENHHVTANLYLPAIKGKLPSVLLFCGHEDVSKATESYQQTAILFAKNGFVVLVIDPISQSERVQLTDASGKALTRGSTTEHTLLNLSSNLVGTSVAAYELFDNVRSLDYLVTRPEVDATKIGCIGNSGGAMQAIYFATFDERIKIIAPCSYLASRERTFELTGAADGCAQIPNEGLAELEMSDYLIADAPKPMLILAGRYDFIDYNGTLQAVDELKKAYKSLGAPKKLSLFTYDDGHGISKPKREIAVQWFRKWFYNDSKTVIEGQLETLTDKDLFASGKEKVNLTYPNEVNIVGKNLELFMDKVEKRAAFAKQTLAVRKTKVQQLLGIINLKDSFETALISKGELGHYDVRYSNLILRKKDEIPLPLRVYTADSPKKVVIWLSDQGTKTDSLKSFYDGNKSNDLTIFADLSGTGETTDQAEFNDPKYFSKDYRNAMLALHLGKPLVGQRTSEILNIIDYIESDSRFKGLPIEINSIGLLGISVLHAAFLDQKITKVNLYACISSYEDFLNQPLAKDRYGAVIYNVLSSYDLPDLVNWIGKEKVEFK